MWLWERKIQNLWIHTTLSLSWNPDQSPHCFYPLEGGVGFQPASQFKRRREGLGEGKLAFEALTWVFVRLTHTSGWAGQLRWELACLSTRWQWPTGREEIERRTILISSTSAMFTWLRLVLNPTLPIKLERLSEVRVQNSYIAWSFGLAGAFFIRLCDSLLYVWMFFEMHHGS